MQRRAPALVLVGAMAFAALGAPPVAEAQEAAPSAERVTVQTSGRPGRVLSMPVVEGSHSWDGVSWSPWVRQIGPVLSRSPVNQRAQRVCITYLLQIWTFTWSQQASRTGCAPIARGQGRVRLPRFDVPGLTRGNWFRMVHGYTWWQGGRRIGYRALVLNRPHEYQCRTSISVCYVTGSGLCLRSPSTGLCRSS